MVTEIVIWKGCEMMVELKGIGLVTGALVVYHLSTSDSSADRALSFSGYHDSLSIQL